ncbi:MAG TPA: carboxypeptidase-like regulatory domain-containing protein, partial [Myxococcota bacterium]
MRALAFGVVAFVAASGCAAPTNPCDPEAPVDVQAKGTRISGVVVDQDGNRVANVAVGVAGRAETVVSGGDGAFSFSDLPPVSSYQIVATPTAPLVGGRAVTSALTCGAHLDGVKVVVIAPPASPE